MPLPLSAGRFLCSLVPCLREKSEKKQSASSERGKRSRRIMTGARGTGIVLRLSFRVLFGILFRILFGVLFPVLFGIPGASLFSQQITPPAPISSFPKTAQTEHYIIKNIRFSPSPFFVGDRVRLSFDLSGPRLPEDPSPISAQAPPPSVQIRNVGASYDRKHRFLRVFVDFSSYKPGPETLPDLILNGRLVRGLPFSTASVFRGAPSGALPLPALLPFPRTGHRIPQTILFFFLLLALVFRLFAFLKKNRKKFLKTYRRKKFYRRLEQEMLLLKEKGETLNARSFSFRCDIFLKEGLSRHFSRNLRSATTKEILALSRTFLRKRNRENLKQLLNRLNSRKFRPLLESCPSSEQNSQENLLLWEACMSWIRLLRKEQPHAVL